MSDSLISSVLSTLNLPSWPLVRLSTHTGALKEMAEKAANDIRKVKQLFDEEVKAIKVNAAGLIEKYNELEAHKNKFVAQNFELRVALTTAEEHIRQLTAELQKHRAS